MPQSLARMGASVTGIDAAPEGTGAAAAHAARDPLVESRTSFRAATAEQLVEEGVGVWKLREGTQMLGARA